MADCRTLSSLSRWADETERKLAFRAQSRSEAGQWQTELRACLIELLGLDTLAAVTPTVEHISMSQQDGYQRELITIQVAPNEFMPCYVLRPDDKPAAPPLVALHGHGTWGAQSVVGLAESDEAQAFIDEYHYDYGLQFVRLGFTVYVPVLRALGQRMETPALPAGGVWQSSCQQVSLSTLLCGKTLLGLRVWDVLRLLDAIQSAEVVCVGFSGGGTTALFAAALDPRLQRVILSGSLSTFRDSLLTTAHCACNYVPRLLQYAELPDIAGLIAPRPLFIEHGLHDTVYPFAAARHAYTKLQGIYRLFGAQTALEFRSFDGAHRWDGRAVAAWR